VSSPPRTASPPRVSTPPPASGPAQPPVRQSARGGGAPRPAGGNGWFGADATARSGESDGAAPTADKPSARPFWLRPVRRDK
jgi:hypothetical protein